MTVWGYFYGGLINPAFMDKLGFEPLATERAWLPGYELHIAPLVNLVECEGKLSYGLLIQTTHAQLKHVYGQLQMTYLPVPVLAYDDSGRARPALCYVVHDMPPGQAEAEHVRNLLTPATALGFPGWYLDHIRSFLPPGG